MCSTNSFAKQWRQEAAGDQPPEVALATLTTVSLRPMNQPGLKPTYNVKATQNPIAIAVDTGTRTVSRASSPASGSASHTLIKIRRYKNAAITADTMATMASA